MEIGLIDADLMWQKHANGRRYGKTKADIFPNLAIMKLSAYHKAKGNNVEWYMGLKEYDIVYISKVFSTSLLHQRKDDCMRWYWLADQAGERQRSLP